MRGHRASKEDTMLLCKYLLKYKAWSPKSAIHELKNIDFIKNNYSNNTLYIYMNYIKHFANKGVHPKNSPSLFRECLETLTRKQPLREEFIEVVENKQPNKIETTLEINETKQPELKEEPTQSKLTSINNKVKLIKENYKQLYTKLELRRIKIEERITLLNNTYNKMLKQCTEEKEALENTYMEELLLKQ